MVNAKIFNILDNNALIFLGIAQPICVVTRASRNKLGLVSKSSARHLYCSFGSDLIGICVFQAHIFSSFFFQIGVCVFQARVFSFFFFFIATVVDQVFCEQCTRTLFIDPQTSVFSNFFIKNDSYGTIHTFKNYFTTVFLVFSFQFQQNKFYPNGPMVITSKVLIGKVTTRSLTLARHLQSIFRTQFRNIHFK